MKVPFNWYTVPTLQWLLLYRENSIPEKVKIAGSDANNLRTAGNLSDTIAALG